VLEQASTIGADPLRRIVGTAQGNPLYAEQLLAAFADDDGDTVPASLRGLLTTRLDRLGPGQRDVLRCASITGMNSTVDALCALLPQVAHRFVERHLDALHRKRLIERTNMNEFRFCHALIRLTAYQSLTREDRGHLHDRYAEWLARDSPADPPPELAQILSHHV